MPRMKNYIAVNIPTNTEEEFYKTHFYWPCVTQLSDLRHAIRKRFQVPTAASQMLLLNENNEQITEQNYLDLYHQRFRRHTTLEFRTTILEWKLDFRKIAAPKTSTTLKGDRFEVRFSGEFQFEFRSTFQDTVEDLKVAIRQKTNLNINVMLIVYARGVHKMLLTDSQLLVDLFLDLDIGSERLIINVQLMFHPDHFSEQMFSIGQSFFIPVFPTFQIRLGNTFSIAQIVFPLKEIGSCDVLQVKEWIFSELRIPTSEQHLMVELHTKPLKDKDSLPSQYFTTCFHWYCQLRLHVYPTTDDALNRTYKEQGVGTLLPIRVTSFETGETLLLFFYRGIEKALEFSIEKRLGVPMEKQRFFYEGKRVFPEQLYEMLRTNFPVPCRPSLSHLKVYFAAQVDDSEEELLDTISKQNISRVRSIVVKHPRLDIVILELSLSKLNNKCTGNDNHLKQLKCCFKKEVTTFTEFDFNHEHDVLSKNNEDLHNLLLANGQSKTVQENLVFSLVVYPTSKEIVERAREEYNMICLQRITVNFLTRQFDIDLVGEESARTVKDIKQKIYSSFRVNPPHLQKLYHENRELDDGTRLIEFNRSMDTERVVFSLVVLPPRKRSLILSGTFLRRNHSGLVYLDFLETDTVRKVKETLGQASGTPPSLIEVYNAVDKTTVSGTLELWESGLGSTVRVKFKVLLELTRNGVAQNEEYLFDHGDPTEWTIEHTIRFLTKHLYPPQTILKADKASLRKAGFTLQTELGDIGEHRLKLTVMERRKNCTLL